MGLSDCVNGTPAPREGLCTLARSLEPMRRFECIACSERDVIPSGVVARRFLSARRARAATLATGKDHVAGHHLGFVTLVTVLVIVAGRADPALHEDP